MTNRLRRPPRPNPDRRQNLPAAPTVEQLREAFPPDVIAGLVDAFYDSVRADDLIGPVFGARVEDWDTHLHRMNLFWGSILRAEPGFHASDRGNPQVLHRLIEELEPAHFDRWLDLFDQTCSEHLSPSAAEHLMGRARRIARALSAHLPAEG